LPSHLGLGRIDRLLGLGDRGRIRFPDGQSVEGVLPGRRSDLHQEGVVQFGQPQIESTAELRPGSHRSAETGSARTKAIHGEDKSVLAPFLIDRVDEIIPEKRQILDFDRRDFARPDSDECVAGRRIGGAGRFPAAVLADGEKRTSRGKENLFPGLRSGNVVEVVRVPAGNQAVLARFDLAGIPLRQVGRSLDRLILHGAVADARTDGLITFFPQPGKEILQTGFGKCDDGSHIDREFSHGVPPRTGWKTCRAIAFGWPSGGRQ
jgi:hypothetical protein